MEFLWDENNISHIRKHGVSPDLAERVFWVGCRSIAPTRFHHRWVIEAEVDGRNYRLVFDRSREDIIYPVACFPL
ncbi:MAG: BrnT family toxin [Holophaga sp.]